MDALDGLDPCPAPDAPESDVKELLVPPQLAESHFPPLGLRRLRGCFSLGLSLLRPLLSESARWFHGALPRTLRCPVPSPLVFWERNQELSLSPGQTASMMSLSGVPSLNAIVSLLA